MSTAPTHGFVRPLTETEQALASIWCDVLKVEQVEIDDDFFSLGGHSLLAVRVIARIRDVFDVDLETPLLLFEHPTIAGLSQALVEAKASSGNARRIVAGDHTEPSPPSFIQEQLWFLDQLAPGSPVYNIVDVISLDGAFESQTMTRAMTELVRRHAVLR